MSSIIAFEQENVILIIHARRQRCRTMLINFSYRA